MEKKYNILIVDDNTDNIQVAMNILKQNINYNIIFATSGEETLARVKEYDFDLILLDIVMEPMDGFEVCKELKNEKITSDIPVIFLTAKHDEKSISNGFALGAVDYMIKPFFADELMARAKTHLELKIYRDTLFEIEIEKNRQRYEQNRLAQMGEMISMIAHQWRQPLTAISSTSVAINFKATLDKLDNETAIKLSSQISDYSQNLSSTIDNFSEFFKPNKEKEETSYTDIVNSVLSIVEISIKNKSITLVKELNSKMIFNTYPNELKQAILNIIKNAKDILIKKEVKNPIITITTQNNILTISDNGGGVPNDIRDKIFDPYFSTKTKQVGTGLGLYMSKTIIEEHCNGKLTIANNKDGAIFKIELGLIKNPTHIEI